MELISDYDIHVIDAKIRVICKSCKQVTYVEPELEVDYSSVYYPGETPEIFLRATCSNCGTRYEKNFYE